MLMVGTLQKRVLEKFVRRLADGATSKIEFRDVLEEVFV